MLLRVETIPDMNKCYEAMEDHAQQLGFQLFRLNNALKTTNENAHINARNMALDSYNKMSTSAVQLKKLLDEYIYYEGDDVVATAREGRSAARS